MKRHVTYSNIAATLALFFALAGSAVAAKHFLINSTRQINPKVLRTLRGTAGPRGQAGPTGPTFSAHLGAEPTPGGEEPIPDGTIAKLEVQVPTPGNLMVSGAFYGVFKCPVNTCPYVEISLWLDGKQVPRSSLLIGYIGHEATAPENGDAQFATTGRTAVSAGHHTLELQVTQKNPSGVVEALTVGEHGQGTSLDATLTG